MENSLLHWRGEGATGDNSAHQPIWLKSDAVATALLFILYAIETGFN
jgi:hypothetical protein